MPDTPTSPSEAASPNEAASQGSDCRRGRFDPRAGRHGRRGGTCGERAGDLQRAAGSRSHGQRGDDEGAGSTEAAPAASEAPAEAATTQEAALPPATAPAGEGIYIQLGSLGKRDGVSAEWARLQKAFPDFLGDMELAVQTVTLEGRGTFHRIQTGPFPNRGTAEEMCAFLKSSDQACIVIKR